MTRSTLLPVACGALIGTAFALFVLPLGYITGTGPFWLRPRYDLNTYLTTWEYFVRDGWRFPLLDVPPMGYPEGGSVLFTDGLPVGQLASKAFYTLTGIAVIPFGWWTFLTYVLQGAMAARVVYAAGARTIAAAAAAAVLTVTCFFFTSRIWHVAISSHFLILWALALYLENVRDRRFTAVEHFLLTSLTLLINAYLFVMVGLLQAVTFATLWKSNALGRRDWIHAAVAGVGVVAFGLVEGVGALFSGSGSLRAAGFGIFSWNLASLVVPPRLAWSSVDVVREVTQAQAEGEAYLGAGNILIVVAWALAARGQIVAQLRRHWLLCVALILCLLFAASNRIYAGSVLLVDATLPPSLLDVASLFRASGRFIWVPAYALMLFALAGLVRSARVALVIPLLIVACAAQFYEARRETRGLSVALDIPFEPLFDEARVRTWMTGHNRLFQFTSWSCGGLTIKSPADRDAFREMQLNLLAARMGMATNTVYTARQIKNCDREKAWAAKPRLASQILYVVSKAEADDTTPLAELLRSPACVDAGWAYACSPKTLEPPAGVNP